MSRAIIIGGGVAGMSAGLALRDQGHQVLVLEKAAVAGGKVGTVSDGEWRVERGPMGILDNEPATQALLARLGCRVVPADAVSRRRYLVRDGSMQPVPSPPQLLTSSLLRPLEKLRLLGEVFSRRGTGDESVAGFFRRHVGRSLADSVVDAMPASVYAGDWDKLSMPSAFPRLWELDQRHGSLLRGMLASRRQPGRLITLHGGMGALSSSLASALGADLRTGVTVDAVEKGGVRAGGALMPADAVVLALPAPDAARVVAGIDAQMADAYRAIPTNRLASVTLGFRAGRALDGVGCLWPRQEGERILGALWMTSVFPDESQAPAGHINLRCMIGGSTDPDALSLADSDLIAACLSSLRRHLGVGEPVYSRIDRWPEAIAQYDIGHARRVATIETRGALHGIFPTGAALRGVGVNDVIREAARLRVP